MIDVLMNYTVEIIVSIHYRLVEADGDITNVHAVATPIPDAPPDGVSPHEGNGGYVGQVEFYFT